MNGADKIGWLKWEQPQFKTHDHEEFNLMLLRNTEGSHWAGPTSCKVCIELPWASPMHSVAPAPGFDVVTSPVETALFGFSQRHQRSQSITVLHGYPLSQQQLIKRLKESPNLSKFVAKAAHRTVRRKLQILLCGKVSLKTLKNILGSAAESRWM